MCILQTALVAHPRFALFRDAYQAARSSSADRRTTIGESPVPFPYQSAGIVGESVTDASQRLLPEQASLRGLFRMAALATGFRTGGAALSEIVQRVLEAGRRSRQHFDLLRPDQRGAQYCKVSVVVGVPVDHGATDPKPAFVKDSGALKIADDRKGLTPGAN